MKESLHQLDFSFQDCEWESKDLTIDQILDN